MKSIILLLIMLLISNSSFAQNTFAAKVTDKDTKQPLIGVNVILRDSQMGSATDENGYVEIRDVPDGTYIIKFSSVGYEEQLLSISFPANQKQTYDIALDPEVEELEEISVNSTRGSRLIQDEPTRVEVIAGEEIDEKISMDPSGISMLLNESTGIQVQQTSTASVNSSFRIQGLDGRYTLLLKDGFPLYGGFSGGLSLIQIPPLDLSQVEIIKGSSSTLYGGGAIAGLINLITKNPAPSRDISFLINATSARGLDVSGFYSQRFENYGITLLASRNTQDAYDNNDDNFSDIPDIRRFNFNPKFHFYFSETSSLELGASFMNEKRLGGSMNFIDNQSDTSDSYFENNNTDRFSTQIKYNFSTGENSGFILKNGLGYFDRSIELSDYEFKGEQFSTFSEAVYKTLSEKSEWVFGLNLWTQNFTDKSAAQQKLSYSDLTFGSFIQNTYDIDEKFSLESGIRGDYNTDYAWFVLPRLSLLTKWSKNISSRLGGGFGYRIPDMFTEDAEQLAFRNILPVDKDNLDPERSYGFNFDINFTSILFETITLSFNNLLFYTQIDNPVILNYDLTNNVYQYSSLNGKYISRGIESNIKLTLDHFKLFSGYTFVNTSAESGDEKSELRLTPKYRVGLVFIYEEHENVRIGLEAYYTGQQKLSSGENARDYWVNGLMIEKMFKNFSMFLNFENFLDTRQSKFGPMFTGANGNPIFAEIYAPTDGRIINGGIKIKL